MADAAAVGFLLQNLKQLLQYHANLILGAETQVQNLENDLLLFQAFLKDSAKQRLEDNTWRVLVGRIRDVVHNAEDVIDSNVTKTARANSGNCFCGALRQPLNLHDIATRLRPIVEEVQNINSKVEWATHNIGNDQVTNTPQRPPELKRDNIVGFKDDSDKIIRYLREETDYLDVISIIGMPGLGKTTLAGKVFHDQTIQREFPTRIWLYISKVFSERDLFLAILKELIDPTSERYKQMQEEGDQRVLAQEIQTCLEGKKFLIVMDDVWTPEDWGKIQNSLPMANHTGKVLITSRHERVFNFVNRHRPPDKLHVLRPNVLSDEDSWLLLQYEAFGKSVCPSELEGFGKEIARNCRGLPLAVTVIGGILVKKFSAADDMSLKKVAWENVSRSVCTYLHEEDPEKRMEKIIAWSYDDLPYHLRACFLYLGMFPEDFAIPVRKLFRMWMAEGFVEQKKEMSREESAQNYLYELISRNLVKVDKRSDDGRVKTCRIHDMLRDFCINEAGSVNENFLHEIERTHEGFLNVSAGAQKYRRICMHSNILDFTSSTSLSPHVRSFVCFSKERILLPKKKASAIPASFKLLRVLEAECLRFKRIPEDMYQLLHLRYLTLRCWLRVIPATLGKLWNLETFIVRTGYSSLEIKADIWKLSQLQHLKTNARTTLPKTRKSGKEGEKLQTLGIVSSESCTEDVFNKAHNLKELAIYGQRNSRRDDKTASFNYLMKLRNLEKLKLVNYKWGGSLPCQFPPKLKRLTLFETRLDSDHYLNIIGLLENLEVLKLKSAFHWYIWDWEAKDGGFRHLEVLHISRTDLRSWKASHHHYPRLRHLELRSCWCLEEVPTCLADNPNFRVLNLDRCSEKACASANKILEAKKERYGEENVKGGAFNLSIRQNTIELPKGISTASGFLLVTVHAAQDVEGKHHTNPYVRLIFQGQEMKTKQRKNNRDPIWEENFTFVSIEPPIKQTMHVEVISSSTRIGLLHREEILGHVDINLEDVVSKRRINDKFHLIGSKNAQIQVELQWRKFNFH